MHKGKLGLFAFIATTMSGMGTLALVCLSTFAIFTTMKNYIVEELDTNNNVILDQHVFEMSVLNNIKMVMGMQVWKWPIPQLHVERDWNGIDYHINVIES